MLPCKCLWTIILSTNITIFFAVAVHQRVIKTCVNIQHPPLLKVGLVTSWRFRSLLHGDGSVCFHFPHASFCPSTETNLQRLRYGSSLGPKQNLSFLRWCHLQAKLGQIVTCKLPSVADWFNFNIEPHEYIYSLNNPSLISKSLRLFYWNNVSGITNENYTGSFLFSRQFKFQTLLL